MTIEAEGRRTAPPKFITFRETAAIERLAEHDGAGPIVFRRLAAGTDFAAAVDFVDLTTIPPGSTIGRHEHVGTEELYFIAAGTALVNVSGEQRRLVTGDVAIVHSNQWHELINDSSEPVQIFVVQVRV